MEPYGAGRMRGFRAPGADPVVPETPTSSRPFDKLRERDAAPVAPAETIDTHPEQEPKPFDKLRGRTSSWRWLVAAAAVLVVAMAVIGALAFRLGTTSAATDAPSPSPSPTPKASATPLATTELYQVAVPSVVLITTSKGSLGSGTVVTDTGTVLTANHVISGGGDVTILFADGTRSPATVASMSPSTDTATLTPSKLPETVVPASIGGGVAVGADVVAMGNPLGLRDTTTTGIVSGLGRTSRTEAGTVKGLIQFDAAVNPGSSGGPLLDQHGQVVGVVVSIANPSKADAFAGIGFAVPIGTALAGGGGDGPGPGGGPQI